MYPADFVWWCWSPIGSGCFHECSYCYAMKTAKRFNGLWRSQPQASKDSIKIDRAIYEWNLPKLPDGKIFVCHTTDLFADMVPKDWIERILEHCWETWAINGESEPTQFIFQTKNPKRYSEFNYIFERFPVEALRFGITLETNHYLDEISKAPSPLDRAMAFTNWLDGSGASNFVTIEPIMKFNLDNFVKMLEQILPDTIWIGADSKNCGLPEPEPDEVVTLIDKLNKFTVVRLKKNLDRLLPKELRMEATIPQ